jgi:hypothetical protein
VLPQSSLWCVHRASRCTVVNLFRVQCHFFVYDLRVVHINILVIYLQIKLVWYMLLASSVVLLIFWFLADVHITCFTLVWFVWMVCLAVSTYHRFS